MCLRTFKKKQCLAKFFSVGLLTLKTIIFEKIKFKITTIFIEYFVGETKILIKGFNITIARVISS